MANLCIKVKLFHFFLITEALEKRLSRQSSTTDNVAETTTDKNKNENQDDTNSKEAMANTILKFQKEIQRLESENDQLKLKSIQVQFLI